MCDLQAPRQHVLAQNIKAGQKFVHGRGGKHWTATSDADTTNMRTHAITGRRAACLRCGVVPRHTAGDAYQPPARQDRPPHRQRRKGN